MSSTTPKEAAARRLIREDGEDVSRHEPEPQFRKATIMYKRFIIRLLTAFAALAAGVTASSTAAHAVLLPDPGVPTPAPTPAPQPLPAAGTPSSSVMVFGMSWELALSIALLVLAAALFVAATVQRRHATHPHAA